MSNIKKMMNLLLSVMLLLMMSLVRAEESTLHNKIENVEFSSLSGGRINIRIQMQEALKNPPAGFTLNNPARIALDFPGVANGLSKNNVLAGQGALKSITLAQAKERTRMVLNLTKSVAYSASINGKDVNVILQASEATVAAASAVETKFSEVKIGDKTHQITNVDFARGKNGEGRIIVDLSDATAGINIKQKGKTIVVDFINTNVPDNLQRRLNVINFNTAVLYVDTMKQGNNSRMVIEPKGNWEQSAYQADKKFIIDVRQIAEDPNKLVQGSKPGFSGEKLSLNFQNVEVRTVFDVIAEFTGLNIIVSDTVTGNITLRLKDVPWDQAMDIIIKNKNLNIRKSGSVIMVAPAEEVAAKDKLQLEANQQIEDLEPLKTEVFTLKYMKADSLKNILTDSGGSSGGSSGGKTKILSKRGTAVLDPRTNTVFVQDTPKYLEAVQEIINKTDIPIKQVMIESRLVIADDKFSKALGSRFGVSHIGSANGGTTKTAVGGQLNSTGGYTSVTSADGKVTATQTGTAGTAQALQTGALTQGTSSQGVSIGGSPAGQDLMSNLPVANSFGNFAFSLFRLPAGLLLNLELSALESDQRGKIVSSPRVTTANQQKAIISQGTKIPYLQASSSGAANVAFVDATLSLEVTPQITPDDKIIMDLEVKKDKVGVILAGTPSIDTQRVQTQVLVANGETAVLGGIYEQVERNAVDKVPFFGDLPVLGNLFKRKTKQQDKTELLIFITPKIMDESLGIK
ncbi:MAG: type IV pilus secretin PilQ [Methylophilaceae bacterium]|nr:type IV pilus secretin PilQ [Methylophilaceae bacterium]